MAVGLFGKWFGGKEDDPPEVRDARGELHRLRANRPALSQLLTVTDLVLTCVARFPGDDHAPALEADYAGSKLASGIPLLSGEPVPLDGEVFRRRWKLLGKDLAPPANPADWLTAFLTGKPDELSSRADQAGLDAVQAGTLFRLACFPSLSRWRAELEPLLHGLAWGEGFCPVCGGPPLLAEFRGLEQVRYLRCGHCAADWEFLRLRCPRCDNRDHRTLGYFHVEGDEGKERCATCEECRGYLKVVSTLERLNPARLLVADAATLHLDLAAADRGYGG